VWHSTGDAFTVDFGKYTPFAKNTFDVEPYSTASSGAARKDALEVTYHYVIRKKAHGSGSGSVAGSESAAADPDVNVKK
jgi:phage tail tape-measure protein